MGDPHDRRDELGEALDLAAHAAREYIGKMAFRPALVNWRTEERELNALADVLVELAARVGAEPTTA